MIPLKIQLKNFLSYGPELQTVDFEPYPLICLSGKNGHGKSALLDAITWAIWGLARKTFGVAKADEGLIRLGQTQMMVILDFSFNGQTYRVRREFAKTYGKPYAVLEFGLLNQETDTLIPLTDKTIRQTQEKIEQLLNLDGESFANSAFLRQGQANEFSKKSAKERKVVLATILGLNRYDAVRTLALHKAKDALTHKQQLLLTQEKYALEVQKKPQLDAHLADVTQRLAAFSQQEQELATRKTKVDAQRSQCAAQQQALQLVQFQQQQLLQQEFEHQHALRSAWLQWRTTQRKLLSMPQHQQLEDQRKQILDTINQHQTMLQKGLEVKEKILAVKESIAVLEKQLSQAAAATSNAKKLHSERLQLEHQASKLKLVELQQHIARSTAEQQAHHKEVAALQTALATAQQHQTNSATIEQQFERRKEYYQQFVSQGTWAKQELDDLLKKQVMVHDDDNPSCPLCEQNLSATRKKFLKKRFEDSEGFLQHRLARLKKVTTALKALLIEQYAQVTALKKSANDAAALTVQITALEKRGQEHATTLTQFQVQHEHVKTLITQQEQVLNTEQKELAQLLEQEQQSLTTNKAYQELRAQHDALELSMKECAYDASAHKNAQQALLSIEQALTEYQQLLNQAPLQEQRKQTIAQLCLQLKKIKKLLIEMTAQVALHKDLPQQLSSIAQQEAELQKSSADIRTQKEVLLQEKGKVEHEQVTICALEKEHAEHVQHIKQLDITIDDYTVLATATSKDGIQALLIDEAIPEIEQEANDLLAKLTNNQAQVFIESLRDLKKGGTKETLDIKISDSVGVRPYEMFSGGEAFRIDFALRIAISKLLARRAGTSLQTLIIDEGFGSQDEEGLNLIMDALYKIQDDFAKIIIVSHLPFMKDQFPVQFIVEKGPNGSTVKTIEQG